MQQIEIKHPNGEVRHMQISDDSTIGRGTHNEIFLDSWRVAKEHARIFKTPSGLVIYDIGSFGGVTINGHRIDTQYGPIKETDIIGIAQFKLKVAEIGGSSGIIQAASPDSRSTSAAYRNLNATQEMLISRENAERAERDFLEQKSLKSIDEALSAEHHKESSPDPSFPLILAPSPRQKSVEFEWRKRIHTELLETMDLRRKDVSTMSDEVLRFETERLVLQIIEKQKNDIPRELDREILCRQVVNEAIGLGPLEELLNDDSVSEIMVNRFDEIYVEKNGKLHRHSLTFTGDQAVLGVIERIVAPLGRRIDESSPMVDARLKDGSRVNAIIPPLALKGATLTIRKFAKRKLNATDLVKFGAISEPMADFLRIAVEARKNIVVSGGTGSGKTTLLNILSNFIPKGERIITVEDAAELQLNHEHLISLESRPSNTEGKGAILIRDLVKNTLRMRPDRIVVGECRGSEALDMLQAMNTGHEGSLTTLHANTPRDGLSRLETMVLMAGVDLPLIAIREQISSAVNLVVQQTRFSCGTRMVTSVTELVGMEGGRFQLQELFKFVSLGYTGPNGKINGYFSGCDMVPTFYEELRATGKELSLEIFKPSIYNNENLASNDGFNMRAQS
jgi:pilus assembly protein CpaF